MKPLLCALALLALCAPMNAQTEAAQTPDVSAAETQDVPEAVTLDSGLVVTPVILPYSQLENMMDVRMWRFLVVPPALTKFYSRVELRTKGQQTKYVGLGSVGDISHNLELTLGILPSNDFSLISADKWRVYTHYREISQGRTIDSGGSASDGINPVKDLKDVTSSILGGYDDRYGRVQPNGEVTLITFGSGPRDEYGKQLESELVLVFIAEPKVK